MKCWAKDGKDAGAVWAPDVNQSVRVPVCAEHAAAAQAKHVGAVRRLKLRGAFTPALLDPSEA